MIMLKLHSIEERKIQHVFWYFIKWLLSSLNSTFLKQNWQCNNSNTKKSTLQEIWHDHWTLFSLQYLFKSESDHLLLIQFMLQWVFENFKDDLWTACFISAKLIWSKSIFSNVTDLLFFTRMRLSSIFNHTFEIISVARTCKSFNNCINCSSLWTHWWLNTVLNETNNFINFFEVEHISD